MEVMKTYRFRIPVFLHFVPFTIVGCVYFLVLGNPGWRDGHFSLPSIWMCGVAGALFLFGLFAFLAWLNEGVVLDEDGIAHIGILGLVTKRISYRDIHAIEPTAPTYDSKGITGLTIRSDQKKIKIKEMVSHYRCLRTDLRERVLRTGYVARETEPSRVVGQFGLGNRWAVAFSSLLWVLLLCFGVDSSIRTNHGITNFGAFIAIVYWISISVFMIQVINLPMLRHRLIVYEDRVERYFRSSEPTAVVRFDEVTSFERPLYAPFYWLCSDDDAIAIPYRSPAVTCVGAQLKLFQASSSVN